MFHRGSGVGTGGLTLVMGGATRGGDWPGGRGRGVAPRSAARIEIVLGDISHEQTEVVVSSASPYLDGAHGVEAAIRRRAGVGVLEACRKIRESNRDRDELPLIATGSGELTSARAILHAFGPDHGERDAASSLARCYIEALEVAGQLGARSIAVPAISTGQRGFPVEAAAPIALQAVREVQARIELVRFVLFDKESYQTFVEVFVASL